MRICLATSLALPYKSGPAINSLERLKALLTLGHEVDYYVPHCVGKKDMASFVSDCLSDHGYDAAVKTYSAIYSEAWGGFLSTEPLTLTSEYDLTLLDEPEHFFEILPSFGDKRFGKTLGITHTNYDGIWKDLKSPNCENIDLEEIYITMNKVLDKCFALSRAVPGQFVGMINGVSEDAILEKPTFSHKFCFYTVSSLRNWKKIPDLSPLDTSIDVFGAGEDANEIMESCNTKMRFLGEFEACVFSRLAGYKCFITASTREVQMSAAMEAFAMGKFVIIPATSFDLNLEHSNILRYSSEEELVQIVNYVSNKHNVPIALSPEIKKKIMWVNVTKNLLDKCGFFDEN